MATKKRKLPLLLAFLLPVIILLGVYVGKGIYPFGDSVFLKLDMYHQYTPFLRSFAEKLREAGSLTYAWDIGIGTNYLPLYAYYLASPFYWLVNLFPAGLLLEFMGYLTIIKIGLCGLTMAYYLSRKFHTDGWEVTVFGVSYALCGYIAAYSWCLMWLDVLVFAPLVFYGLECLVKWHKPFLYCVTLGLAIFTNYYISIMLCIFLVLYFIGLMIMNPPKGFKEFLKRCGLFAFFSLLAGGLAAILLIPVAYGMGYTASADSTFPQSWTSYFSTIEMLTRHLMVVETEQGLDHWPNIYSGILVLLCLPFYYMNKHVDYKEKVVKTVILGVMLFSFSTNIPNYVWHGMHFPNSLPARQSYLYTILLLTMCFEGLRGLRGLSKKQILLTFWGALTMVLLTETLNTNEDIHFIAWVVSIVFLALYTLYFYLDITKRILHGSMFILLIGTLVIENGVNMAVTSVNTVGRTDYWNNAAEFKELVSMINDDWPFYRVEKFSRRTKNDAAWIGYNSASIFSSTAHAGISDFYKRFGLEGNTNAYAFTGATPFSASLLSVKYQLSTEKQDDSPLRTEIGNVGSYYLYQNIYTLPVGFMLPADIESLWNYEAASPALSQNSLSDAVAHEQVLVELEGTATGDSFTFTPLERGHIFVHIDTSSISKVTVTGGGKTKTFDEINRGYFADLGYCDAGETITVKADGTGKTMAASAYTFDEAAFIRTWNNLADESFNLTSFVSKLTETTLEGTVTAMEPGLLFLSIPYEKSWTVIVDGSPVETEEIAEAFLGVPLSAGEHTVRLENHTQGLKEGALISAASIGLLVILFLIAVFNAKRKTKAQLDMMSAIQREAETMTAAYEEEAREFNGRDNEIGDGDAEAEDVDNEAEDMTENSTADDDVTDDGMEDDGVTDDADIVTDNPVDVTDNGMADNRVTDDADIVTDNGTADDGAPGDGTPGDGK